MCASLCQFQKLSFDEPRLYGNFLACANRKFDFEKMVKKVPISDHGLP